MTVLHFPKFLKLLNFEQFSLLWIAMSEKSLLSSRKCYILQRWLGWSPSPAWQWPKATAQQLAQSNGEDWLRLPDGTCHSKEAAATYPAQLISLQGCQVQQNTSGENRHGRLRECTAGRNYCGKSAIRQSNMNIRTLNQSKTLLPFAQSSTESGHGDTSQAIYHVFQCFTLPEVLDYQMSTRPQSGQQKRTASHGVPQSYSRDWERPLGLREGSHFEPWCTSHPIWEHTHLCLLWLWSTTHSSPLRWEVKMIQWPSHSSPARQWFPNSII